MRMVRNMNRLERLLAHLGDFDVVVGGDADDGDEKAGEVDGGEGIAKDEGCGGNSHDFFEDAADGEGYDGGALQKAGRGSS